MASPKKRRRVACRRNRKEKKKHISLRKRERTPGRGIFVSVGGRPQDRGKKKASPSEKKTTRGGLGDVPSTGEKGKRKRGQKRLAKGYALSYTLKFSPRSSKK